MITPDAAHAIRPLSGDELARSPRSEDEIDFWFSEVGPKRHRWKSAETKEWRLRLAISGAEQNREALLRPFLERAPTSVDFNTAHVAAVLGTPEALELAKKRKTDFSQVWLVNTCMSIAAELGHVGFIKLLLEDGCPYVIAPGRTGERISPLRAAIQAGHRDAIELLKEHAIPEDLAAAVWYGDAETVAALKDSVVPPEQFSCPDERMAMFVVESFPDVSLTNLFCRTLVGTDLATTIVARHPTLRPEEIVPQLVRMSIEGLRVLFDACDDLGARYRLNGEDVSLPSFAMRSPRVEVMRELVERGVELPGVAEALKHSHDPEVIAYLTALVGPKTDEEFFESPDAEGFRGRFRDSFLGVVVGSPYESDIDVLGLRVYSESGVVNELQYSAYEITGDAFGVISSELDARFSSRAVDKKGFRTWVGEGLTVTLIEKMDDAGLKLTLTVVQAASGDDEASPQQVTPQDLQQLKKEFANTFDQLEAVSVEHGSEGFTFSGTKKGSDDAGVFVTWPRSPWDSRGRCETSFVDAVLSDLRHSEELWDGEDDS